MKSPLTAISNRPLRLSQAWSALDARFSRSGPMHTQLPDDATLGFDAPDDPFAAQLQRGYRRLKFAEPLERDYRSLMLREQRGSALALMTMTIALWALFIGLDMMRLDVIANFPHLAPDVWLAVAARWITMALLVGYAIVLTRSESAIPAASLACYLAVGVSVSISVVVITTNGKPAIEIVQIVLVMAAFFPIGLTYRQALVASFIVACTATAPHVVGPAAKQLSGDLSVPVSALVGLLIGALGGYVLEHARRQQFLLRGMLRRQALFDPLTGLANRRLFEHHAQRLLGQSARLGHNVVFAVIDVDFFKQYNDLYGHQAGDEALQQVALSMQASARRPLDLAVRLGGEEFGLLLHDTDEHEASRILETLRRDIAALGLKHALSQAAPTLTVSIGAARSDGSQTLDQLRGQADELLYVSKHAGRNRVTVAWAGNDNDAEGWSVDPRQSKGAA